MIVGGGEWQVEEEADARQVRSRQRHEKKPSEHAATASLREAEGNQPSAS